MQCRIVVFGRSPVVGRVKSRLAARLGRRAACFWYRRLLEATLRNALATGFPVELWVTPHPDHPWLRGLCRRHGVPLRRQPPGDLGQRMLQALRQPGRVVVIGADCPAVSAETMTTAATGALAQEDLLVVPAEDGGYVLVAADQPPVRAFRRMPWGTSMVLRCTRQRVSRGGGCLQELGNAWDVDTLADLHRLLRRQGIRPWRRISGRC
ncbi:TIGR04282 family arsenosugar biosynthesis glycosyltransferase [Methylonatrum kenyense]|uniref:TIGR04282 family arsenosugar biosynthesis glycosyltransferase n=1 Tax=Methylonatrum kenyense TaxID=455253 RepID=UPI0020BE1923|nr:TIGR04282 family arsenosugar biosynthesis glycosyltransferase [Methylonatrum kenyense]